MEFYNDKLLPKGLHQIIAAFTPEDIYDNFKVITLPRKERPHLQGQSHDNDYRREYHIKLWPTTISEAGLEPSLFYLSGTYSFSLWQKHLFVALHELGHLHTREVVNQTTEEEYNERGDAYQHIEKLADDFAYRAMVRILEVNPRLGMPTGALTGYPGIKAYERRSGSFDKIDKNRIVEWRAIKCDAQITLKEVVRPLWNEFYKFNQCLEYDIAYPTLSRLVHNQATIQNIGRYFVNRSGKRFLMFNISEAIRIVDICLPFCAEIKARPSLATMYKKLGSLSGEEEAGPGNTGMGDYSTAKRSGRNSTIIRGHTSTRNG